MKRTDIDQVISEYRDFQMRVSSVRWNLNPRKAVSDRYADDAMAATLVNLGIDQSPKEFLDSIGAHDVPEGTLDPLYEIYMRSLRDDIADCLTPEQQAVFERTAMTFLPIGKSEAMCVAEDTRGNRLDGSLIIVNDGLYYVLQQLFTALIFEELQGDLAMYHRDGSEAFKWAYRLFANPSSALVGRVQLELEDPAAQGEAQSYLSRVTTKTMQFIGLHEFAHVWLGHHELQGRYRLFLTGNQDRAEEEPSASAINDEYEADAFALRRILDQSSSNISRWANFYAISYLFEFFSVLEDRGDHLNSNSHPPARDRLARLQAIMAAEVGGADEFAYLGKRSHELTEKWSKGVTNKFINVVVEASDASGLLQEFTDAEKRVFPVDGAEVEFLGKNRGKGLIESKDVILIGVSLAGSVPVNLFCSWLFDRLKPTKANIIVVKVDGAEVSDPDELAALLAKKIGEAT